MIPPRDEVGVAGSSGGWGHRWAGRTGTLGRGCLMVVVLMVLSMASAQSLTVTGACPGEVAVEAVGLTPGGRAALIAGDPGVGLLPGGPCPELDVGILRPWSSMGPIVDRDGDGALLFTPTLPPGACDREMVVVDLETCTVSEPVPLDAPAPCAGGFADIRIPVDVDAYRGCTELDGLYLHITDGVGDVSLPLLRTVHSYVYFHQNTGLGTVSLPALETVGQYVYFHQNVGMPEVDLSSLRSVGEYAYFHQNDGLARIDLGALETVGGYLYMWENTELITASLDSLAEVEEYVAVVGNGDLCLDPLDWPAICADVSVDAPECD
jgi:hypothetical protein